METSNGGRCIGCRNHTTGINCEQCDQYYYPQPGVPVNATNYCTGTIIIFLYGHEYDYAYYGHEYDSYILVMTTHSDNFLLQHVSVMLMV